MVPVALYAPDDFKLKNVKPILFCPGYDKDKRRNAHCFLDYGHLAQTAIESGCAFISMQCHLADDPQLSMEHPYMKTRMPDWQEGVRTIAFVMTEFQRLYPWLDWNNVILSGHSNGGDTVALAYSYSPGIYAGLATFDNRRHPLPDAPGCVTFRACDFPPDPGVIPEHPEHLRTVSLGNVRHSQIGAAGSDSEHAHVAEIFGKWLIDNV